MDLFRHDNISAPTGPQLHCRAWPQEAAMRMLMNNLDARVGEKPQDLIVYGGRGRAARSWPAYDAIVKTLLDLGDNETLLVQSGSRSASFAPTPMLPVF